MAKAEITNGFVFFWGAAPPQGVFSNWYKHSFEHEGKRFNCSEQYMMYAKAVVFDDESTAAKIMKEKDPREQKALGRQVKNFDAGKWMAVCQDIMVPALVSKFEQDPYALEVMLSTEDAIIVEASPFDNIWGIGLSADNPNAQIPGRWKGKNYLGNVLMRARDELRRRISEKT